MPTAYFLMLPGIHMLDLAGPLQILSTVAELDIGPLAVRCVGPHSSVQAFQGIELGRVGPLPARLLPGDLVLAIGSKMTDTLFRSPAWRDTADWLRGVAADAKERPTIAAVCTGAYLLGEAGLLDGRLCTTHYAHVGKLRAKHPNATVVDNRIFVSDGNIWTSAGVASGIDMALQLVADTFGDDAAIRVARENVVPFRRFSSDPELASKFRSRSHGNALVHAVQDAISADLSVSVSDPSFAQTFATSVRHLSRVFARETGLTPKQYQLALRMDKACRLLEASSLPIEEIAEQCGFASVQAFRACWNKAQPMTPGEFRQAHPGERIVH